MKSIVQQQLNLPAHAPVMVLPNATLFPNALLPLHIFEPRYREMLAWCLERHRMFCVALMKRGITEARTDEDFHHIAGLGLIRACVANADGTSNLVLQGLARVHLIGFVQEHPFRIAELRELRSEATAAVEAEALSAKVIELCAEARERGLEIPARIDEQLARLSNPEVVADIVAHAFLWDPHRRQQILEQLGVGDRLRALIHHLRAQIE